MHYLWQHLEHILSVYDGKLPLHHFLKQYFKQHPRLGSRDRRGLSDAVYAWYRVGKALKDQPGDLRAHWLAAMQLSRLKPKAFASFFPDVPPPAVDLQPVFPYQIDFSEGITASEWLQSLLQLPRLFLRIRQSPDDVERRLKQAGVELEWISNECLALPNGTKLDGLLPDTAYVVQDASSQATGTFLKGSKGESWWDCCSGAGGKSLMLADHSRGITHLCTDIRSSILQNLTARFERYHLPPPERKVLDANNAADVAAQLGGRQFDGIICDVPCSGSGTWARTPESCYFFDPATLALYAERQKGILQNALQYLKPGGRLVYITCSVFRAENESVVENVLSPAIKLEHAGLMNGIAISADSLFVAVLTKV